jgi:hypothetical protein
MFSSGAVVLTAKEREVLITVITYHYRDNIERCGCGWSDLGRSHPEHVVQVFEESIEALQ